MDYKSITCEGLDLLKGSQSLYYKQFPLEVRSVGLNLVMGVPLEMDSIMQVENYVNWNLKQKLKKKTLNTKAGWFQSMW